MKLDAAGQLLSIGCRTPERHSPQSWQCGAGPSQAPSVSSRLPHSLVSRSLCYDLTADLMPVLKSRETSSKSSNSILCSARCGQPAPLPGPLLSPQHPLAPCFWDTPPPHPVRSVRMHRVQPGAPLPPALYPAACVSLPGPASLLTQLPFSCHRPGSADHGWLLGSPAVQQAGRATSGSTA